MTQPTRRDRYRPMEFIGISFAVGLVAGLVVLMSTRDLKFALIVLAIGFIGTLVVMAMFILGIKPNKEEIVDIEEMSAEDKAGH